MNSDALLVISSDGHVSPKMEVFRPYVDPSYRELFEEFLVDFQQYGARTAERRNLQPRMDPENIDEWEAELLETGRWERFHDSETRLEEAEREGVAAEVLFPDFGGMPFELQSPSATIGLSAAGVGQRYADPNLIAAGMRSYNRWLADFVSKNPERFFGQAVVSWDGDVDEVVAEIRRARNDGLRGLVLPKFGPERPLFHPDLEPVWDVIDELDMVVNTHVGASGTSKKLEGLPGAPHPALALRLAIPEMLFSTRNLLSHLIWGGVMERHPNVKFVFTEQGSGWERATLESMDYAYRGSFFRTDYHDVIRCLPSEYFARQCYLGSSILARVEIASRYQIGVSKMMIGMDMPHHEGMLLNTTREYLRATLGAENVAVDEARLMLGENAAAVFGFDLDRLAPVVERIGLRPQEVLTPPERDLYRFGDVHRPASSSTL